jgi:multiple sugar transport system ATP-binding protein
MGAIAFEHVTKEFDGGVRAVDDLDIEIEDGEFVIFVGPSGCGKTTALRMVAGLETATSGRIRIDGRVVNDVPPAGRDIAMVFQNYALYPHMSVRQNIAFPLRQQRVDGAEVDRRVREAAELLGLGALLERKPRELSGGQRQRVAMGRALVRRPRAFLMDEPLSNLDAKLRVDMRTELIELHRQLGITTIYVTHDQTEAMTLGDRVVVMRDGVVQQVAAPEELYHAPANLFVAGFVGTPSMNTLAAEWNGDRLLAEGNLTVPGELAERLPSRPGRVLVGIRPEDLSLAERGAAVDLEAQVRIVEHLGPETLAHLDLVGSGTRVVARLDSSIDVRVDERRAVAVRWPRVRLFDAASGAAVG